MIVMYKILIVSVVLYIACHDLTLIFRHVFVYKPTNIMGADIKHICIFESDLKSFDDRCHVFLRKRMVGKFLKEGNSLCQQPK